MADPWLGEIKLLPFDFVPRSYAACDGALMSIAQNTALFALLGTTYGGDGRTTFALPDLRDRLPLPGAPATQFSLPLPQLSQHTQRVVVSAAAVSGEHTSFATRPTNRLLVSASSGTYTSGAVDSTLAPGSLGGSAASVAPQLSFVIALVGSFPSKA